MENTTRNVNETVAKEIVSKYGYIIDSIAAGLIGDKTFFDKEDLHQQGVLVIMEGARDGRLRFKYPSTDEDIIAAITEYLTKELSVYVNNIESYMSRNVRCNRVSNVHKENSIMNKLFEESESTVDKKVLHELMYHGGKFNKYDTAASLIAYLMAIGVLPTVPVEMVITDDKEASDFLEIIAECLL